MRLDIIFIIFIGGKKIGRTTEKLIIKNYVDVVKASEGLINTS